MVRRFGPQVAGLVVAAALALASCGVSDGAEVVADPSSDPTSTTAASPSVTTAPTVELTDFRACGVQFWASTAADDLALRITVPERTEPTTEPTTYQVELPDPDVEVTVLRGRDLSRNFCTDALDIRSDPTSSDPAAAGAGTVVLDPEAEVSCGTLAGRVTLDGLETADGTTIAPLDFEASGPGCYGG